MLGVDDQASLKSTHVSVKDWDWSLCCGSGPLHTTPCSFAVIRHNKDQCDSAVLALLLMLLLGGLGRGPKPFLPVTWSSLSSLHRIGMTVNLEPPMVTRMQNVTFISTDIPFWHALVTPHMSTWPMRPKYPKQACTTDTCRSDSCHPCPCSRQEAHVCLCSQPVSHRSWAQKSFSACQPHPGHVWALHCSGCHAYPEQGPSVHLEHAHRPSPLPTHHHPPGSSGE